MSSYCVGSDMKALIDTYAVWYWPDGRGDEYFWFAGGLASKPRSVERGEGSRWRLCERGPEGAGSHER
jgi:hypothetical protein